MPLSISSSNERIPVCRYKRIWLLSLCVCLALSAIVEYAYRNKGYFPTVNDTRELWSYWRDQVYESNGFKKIVVIGASRAQVGIVPSILEQEFPEYKAIHLAINGKGCVAALKDLANDKDFDGIVICSMTPSTLNSSKLDDPRDYVEHHKSYKRTPNSTINLLLAANIQESLCIMNSYNTVEYIVKHRILLPKPFLPYIRTQFNRYRRAFYFDKLSVQELGEMKINRLNRSRHDAASYAISIDEFVDAVNTHIAPLSDAMSSKNATVIFLRMPESGKYWEFSSQNYPKDLYWDEFAGHCRAPTIHFADYQELSKFECPEGSHLDYRDALEFTRNLSHVIKRLDCLP